ncbi:MAG: Gfo/Idh/MocA family oxidoreductase [Pseudomonadota bacterium]
MLGAAPGSETKPVRVAIAGAGYFAAFHYDGWVRIPDVALVGCADIAPQKAEAIARRFDVPTAFADVARMLDDTEPDILDIATPPQTHSATIELAAARGIDVICQKPFCTSFDEARIATKRATDAGIRVIVHENFRFQPWYRKIKSLIAQDALGDVYQAMFRLRPGDGQGANAYLERQPYFQTMPRFLIHETGVHLIDVFRFLFGDVERVFADLRRLNPVIKGEDAGLMILAMKNGIRCVFDGNRLVDHAANNRRLTLGELTIEGSKSTLRLNGDGEIYLRNADTNAERKLSFQWRNDGFGGDCVYELQSAVIRARKTGGPYENEARDYLANLAVENAAYVSNETGRMVEMT